MKPSFDKHNRERVVVASKLIQPLVTFSAPVKQNPTQLTYRYSSSGVSKNRDLFDSGRRLTLDFMASLTSFKLCIYFFRTLKAFLCLINLLRSFIALV